ncbi:MAG: hypothetical protein IPF99_00205 [Deltaproteobacteria bacterium]|nr:hypothetical protein [Deltaproteobacteria bacterium]
MRSSTRLGYVGLGLFAGAALAGCGTTAATPADAAVAADTPVLSASDGAAPTDLGLSPTDLGFTSDGNPIPPSDAGPGACVPDRALWDSQMRGHVQRQCGTCHGATPSYGAPFSLLDYDANLLGAVGMRRVDRIAANLITGRMPPAGTPSPTDEVRNSIVQWATCGAQTAPAGTGLRASAGVYRSPEMAPADLPHFDLLANRYAVGPDVSDRYQCFVFDAPVTEARFIRRFEVRVDQSAVVHHVVLLRDPMRRSPNTPYSCYSMPEGSEYAYAWAPGQNALQFPDGGLRVSPGERYVMQIHYNNGRHLPGIVDSTGVRVFHAPPGGTEWGMVSMGPTGFSIPARSAGTAESACTLTAGSRLLTGMPHMHELGTDFEETMVRASGAVEPLISLQGWRFESQLFYDTPVTFQAGDRVITRCSFNNTSSRTVTSGVRTSDEMCFNFAYVTPPPPERFCDEAIRETTDVMYRPGTCAPPGASTTLPLVTSPLRIGAAPMLMGGVIPAAHWELIAIEYWASTDRTPIGTLSLTNSNLRGRGQLWTEAGRVIVDIASAINIVVTSGARYAQDIPISFTATYPGEARSPLSLTAQCPSGSRDVPSTVQYEVEGERLTVGLPTQSEGGVMITPRYIFRREG